MKKEIKEFIDNNSWFEFEEYTEDMVIFSSREHGDVGEEEAGIEDILEAERLGSLVEENFGKNIIYEVEECDEWIYLNITL